MAKFLVIQGENSDGFRRRYSLYEVEKFLAECRTAGMDMNVNTLNVEGGLRASVELDD